MSVKPQLIEIDWPDWGEAAPPPRPTVEELQQRLDTLRARAEARGLTHLAVYGDREHFANLAYLTGFDPRFEEALLVLTPGRTPLLIVGNECEGYLPVSPLHRAGQLRHERFPSFSLLDQQRHGSRPLRDILADEGIGRGARVGGIGWKYYPEFPDAAHALDLPAYLVDALRELAGRENVVNETALLMHPQDGMRASCSAAEIAYFEWSNTLASEAMKRIIWGVRDGIMDYDLMRLAEYPGVPLSCHMTLVHAANLDESLSSPVGAPIRRGSPLAGNVSYWGSNICRAGWVAASAADLPVAARDYVAAFVGPYVVALAKWFDMLRLGTPGGDISRMIQQELPFDDFGIFLNAGHLIHLDEWLSSPIYPDSAVPIRSGMVMQVDVIPSSPIYSSTRMEDGIAIADGALRAELAARFPACYARCQQRRAFMREVLGIGLPEEVLPLSNMAGIVPPYFLAPQQVVALRGA